MLKILIILISIVFGYAAFILLKKISKAQFYIQKYHAKKSWTANQPAITPKTIEDRLSERTVDAYELELFDDIAQHFLQQKLRISDISHAACIQSEWLNKMPMHTRTEIRHLDLNEWSIIWQFYEQSLEYYVGRYGVFYTHVDRDGIEQRIQLADEHNLEF